MRNGHGGVCWLWAECVFRKGAEAPAQAGTSDTSVTVDMGSEILAVPPAGTTGRPGDRTTETNGGSSVSHLARAPCVPLTCTRFRNRRVCRLPGEVRNHFHFALVKTFTLFAAVVDECPWEWCLQKCRKQI